MRLKGLTKWETRQGCAETPAQLQDWAIFNHGNSREIVWDFMNEALEGAGCRHLALQLWLAATANNAHTSVMRTMGLSVAQLNPDGASRMADMLTETSADSAKIGLLSREAAAEVGFAPDAAIAGRLRIKLAGAEVRAESAEAFTGVRTYCAAAS